MFIKNQHALQRNLLKKVEEILQSRRGAVEQRHPGGMGNLPDLLGRGIAISRITMDYQHTLQRQIVQMLREFAGVGQHEETTTSDYNSTGSAERTSGSRQEARRPDETQDSQRPINIVTEVKPGKQRIAIPLALNNHYDEPQAVRLQATPLRSNNNILIPAERISFQPGELQIPPKGSVTVLAVIDITEEFLPGEHYHANFHILGSKVNRTLAFTLKVRDDHQETPPASDASGA